MSDEPIRLSKLMAQRGLCSRREADEFIAAGLVEVDGEVISQLGTRVSPDARVNLRPQARRQQASQVTILLNKPVGYVSTQPEPGYQPAIALITPENQFGNSRQRLRREHLRGLAVAGRLDIDSQGLLLLTQDGRLARQIIGEERQIEKEYLVRVSGLVTEEKLRLLRHGLSLDGRVLLPAKVDRLNADQLRFVLREGRKRQIRRMCEQVGLLATGLKRVRIGRILLGKLPEGKWRFLEPWETLD
jgi:23S rRNA pseudouridine2604 synthase